MINCPKHQDNIIEKASYILMYNKYQENLFISRTGCSLNNPPPSNQVDISTSNETKCATDFGLSSIGSIFYYDSGQKISSTDISNGTKLTCRCLNSTPPLTGQNRWYRRISTSGNKSVLIYTHSYQKDANGNIFGVDSFNATTQGDTLYCVLTDCSQNNYNAYSINIK